jgi:hypothetical protein
MSPAIHPQFSQWSECLRAKDELPNIARYAWCCRTGLNCRPLPYQGSALPLSYGSTGRHLLARSARKLPQGVAARKESPWWPTGPDWPATRGGLPRLGDLHKLRLLLCMGLFLLRRKITSARSQRRPGRRPPAFASLPMPWGRSPPLPPARGEGILPAGLASSRLFSPNHWHDPSALRRRPGAARGGAAGELGASKGPSASAPGNRAASAPGKRAARVPRAAIAANRRRGGTGLRGREGVPRFRRICRGQAVRVNDGGMRRRPARFPHAPCATGVNRRHGCAD